MAKAAPKNKSHFQPNVAVMTPAHFTRVCTLLFGKRFIHAAARALKMDPSTVQRYAKGTSPCHLEPASKLIALMAKHVRELQDIAQVTRAKAFSVRPKTRTRRPV